MDTLSQVQVLERREKQLEDKLVSDLLAEYKQYGDPQTAEQLLLLHARLLNYIVSRHSRSSSEPYDDLLQVGRVGFLKAVSRFEPDSGARFGSYAYAMIDGELRHHHRDTGLMKRPRWARTLYSQISDATIRLTEKLGRPPSSGEIAEEVNITEEGLRELMRLFHETDVSSLEQEVDFSSIKSLRHESFSLPIEDRIALEHALDSLSELQRRIVYLFFYKDLTQTEIGRSLGMSQRKVSRTIASATGSLRNLLRSER